jgi:hypothetical protein
MKKNLIGCTIILLIISFSSFIFADSQITTKDKGTEAYKGTLTGEWSGEVMGAAVSGTFTVDISSAGKVTGTYSGFQSGTITGTISTTGQINAKGSAGISEWDGQLKSSNSRLSGTGTWTGYNVTGSWKSN